MSKTQQDAALTPEQPKAEERPKGTTPWEHGRAAGLVLPDGRRKPEFRAAETLHGWSSHVQHTASPLYITREAFDAAINAAQTADKTGSYTPHQAALAPHLQPKGDI